VYDSFEEPEDYLNPNSHRTELQMNTQTDELILKLHHLLFLIFKIDSQLSSFRLHISIFSFIVSSLLAMATTYHRLARGWKRPMITEIYWSLRQSRTRNCVIF